MRIRTSLLSGFVAAVFCVAIAVPGVWAGNSFPAVVHLRVDLPEVYNAGDYRVDLLTWSQPSVGGHEELDFTAAWLGVFLGDPYGPGQYPGQFTQVGFRITQDGPRWFVYAEPGVSCLRGSTTIPGIPDDGMHCYGDVGDLVNLYDWHRFELKLVENPYPPYEDYWVARVYDVNEVSYTVAHIYSSSPRIFYRACSDTEEGYWDAQDPYLTVDYYHSHPQYYSAFGWQDWLVSTAGTVSKTEAGINSVTKRWANYMFAEPSSICPTHYGIIPDFLDDPWIWHAGSYGDVCNWLIDSHAPKTPIIFKNW